MNVAVHQRIGGIALQLTYLDRLALRDLPHAGLLAKRFGGAHSSAHSSKYVLGKNRFRRRFRSPRCDLADEQRDVDFSRACIYAGRVMAKIALIGGDHRLMVVQSRMQIGKVVGVLPPRETIWDNARCKC